MAEELNTGVETTETVDAGAAEETEVLTITKEELARLLQKEGDMRATQATKTVTKKYEKQLSLSKLDGDAREKAEKDNRIAELEEQLAQFHLEKNRSELKSVLSSRGLSAEFADIVAITDDIEASQANIDKLDKLFKAAVKAEVEKRLAGNAPRGNSATNPAEMTREQASKMTMLQKQQLLNTNPELYKKLFN